MQKWLAQRGLLSHPVLKFAAGRKVASCDVNGGRVVVSDWTDDGLGDSIDLSVQVCVPVFIVNGLSCACYASVVY